MSAEESRLRIASTLLLQSRHNRCPGNALEPVTQPLLQAGSWKVALSPMRATIGKAGGEVKIWLRAGRSLVIIPTPILQSLFQCQPPGLSLLAVIRCHRFRRITSCSSYVDKRRFAWLTPACLAAQRLKAPFLFFCCA